MLDEERPERSSLSAADLRMFACLLGGGTTQKLRTARCLLSKASFNHLISCSSRFVEVCL
jgi:hypothetical protein